MSLLLDWGISQLWGVVILILTLTLISISLSDLRVLCIPSRPFPPQSNPPLLHSDSQRKCTIASYLHMYNVLFCDFPYLRTQCRQKVPGTLFCHRRLEFAMQERPGMTNTTMDSVNTDQESTIGMSLNRSGSGHCLGHYTIRPRHGAIRSGAAEPERFL